MLRRFWQSFVLIVAFGFSAPSSAAEIEAYGRLPAIEGVEISEDGTMLAFIVSGGNQQQVVVQRVADGEVLRRIGYENSKIRAVQWAGLNHVLIERTVTSAQMRRFYRGEYLQVASLNIRSGNLAQLPTRVLGGSRIGGESLYENVIFDLMPGTWQGEPVAYANGVARTGVGQPDLLRFNLDSGTAQVVHLGSEETDGFLVSREGALLARSEYTSSSGRWRMSIRDGSNWRQVFEITAPLDRPWMSGLSTDGGSVLLRTEEQDGSYRLRPISLTTGEIGADVMPPGNYGLLFDRNDRNIGTWYLDHYPTYRFNDPQLQAAWTQLTQSFPNRVVRMVSATPDYQKLIVYIEGTEFPGSYMIYNRSGPSLDLIANAYPGVDQIAEVRAVSYRAGDGLQLTGYLTLPPGRTARGLPLVVLPHGGPEGRDSAGFDWMAQAIASRGYAVFQPNFRGSTVSASVLAAGYGQWGRAMQTDVSDGVAYLASQGTVDASRVCVMGASYGGYVALAGVTLQSGIYRCAVSIAGVSDPGALLGRAIARAGSNSATARYWMRFMGVESGDDPRLRDISPRYNASSGGNVPVLLIHGRDDVVVEYNQTSEMAQALRAAGRPVEVVDLRQEDHWLSREPTRIQTITSALTFIERHNPPN